MPVYSMKDKALLDELQDVSRLYGLAVANLSNALANGVVDDAILRRLRDAMDELNARMLAVQTQLDANRLDR